MSGPLTERQRELVKKANETVSLTAAATAAGMRGVDLNSREAVYQAAYGHTKDQLAGLLVIIDELLAAVAEDSRMVGEIRGVLTMLSWDISGRTISPTSESPQYVLGQIERIIGGER